MGGVSFGLGTLDSHETKIWVGFSRVDVVTGADF